MTIKKPKWDTYDISARNSDVGQSRCKSGTALKRVTPGVAEITVDN